MSDILYILGKGSKHDNMEIRLSLRTVEKYAKNLDRVFVCGFLPDFLQNVVYIECEDKHTKEQNHVWKVIKAIRNGISDNFLLMNDDFFMLKPFDVDNYPYFVRGVLEKYENPSRYQKILNRTREYLINNGIENPLAYNSHCPMIYNGKKFESLARFFEEHKLDKIGFSPRVLYGNLFVGDGVISEDCKLHDGKWRDETKQGCISTKADCKDILEKLEKIFPKRSKYEKED